MKTETQQYDILVAEHRERLGRRVREVWIAWAKQQPNPKPSWLVEWDGLSEPDKEVDRRIGCAIWGDCIMDNAEAIGGQMLTAHLLSEVMKERDALKIELETAKADRNRAALQERQKYLPMLSEIRDELKAHAESARFVAFSYNAVESQRSALKVIALPITQSLLKE